MTSTSYKRFDDYCSYYTALSHEQSEGIAVQEVGQEWDFLLTLRLSNTTSSKTRTPTMCDRLLLHCIDRYLEKLHSIQGVGTVYRSVYLHKLGDDYHAHIFSKYPLNVEKNLWDDTLRSEWLKLPLLNDSDPYNDICFHQRLKEADSLEWGVYGIKGNGEQTAWILDSSIPFRNLAQAYKRGHRRLKRLGKLPNNLSIDFKHDKLARQNRKFPSAAIEKKPIPDTN